MVEIAEPSADFAGPAVDFVWLAVGIAEPAVEFAGRAEGIAGLTVGIAELAADIVALVAGIAAWAVVDMAGIAGSAVDVAVLTELESRADVPLEEKCFGFGQRIAAPAEVLVGLEPGYVE